MPEDSKLEAEHQIILDLCKQSEVRMRVVGALLVYGNEGQHQGL